MPADQPRPADLSLLLSDAQGHPVAFSIPEGTSTVGSASDNDLVLEHPSVPAHQLVIIREGDSLTLQDLFSGETRVNGETRRAGPLVPGDVLSLGEVRARVMRVAPSRDTQPLARDRATTRRLRVSGALRRGPELDALAADPPTAAATGRQPAPTTRRSAAAPPTPEPPSTAGVEPDALQAAEAALARAEEDARVARERDARRARALARGRQLADELMVQEDFELLLDKVAVGFLDVFGAERAVTILFEEDGRNPLLTVERRRDGTDEGAGLSQEIIDRCLQVRSVIRVAGAVTGLAGLAAPLVTQGRALGLLYFERGGGLPLDLDDVHLMALLTDLCSLLIAPLVG